MTSQPKRRFLPRFGLKTLFALVLIVATYFGSWPWLEEKAHHDVANTFEPGFINGWESTLTTAPYVVSNSVFDRNSNRLGGQRRYYLWLFGWTVRLPWTTTDAPEPATETGEGDAISGRSLVTSGSRR